MTRIADWSDFLLTPLPISSTGTSARAEMRTSGSHLKSPIADHPVGIMHSTPPAPWDKMGIMQRRDFVILAGAAAAMPMTIHAEEKPGNQSGNNNMAAPVVRISLWTFDAEKASVVEAKLIESKAALEPGIRGMRCNLGHYAASTARTTLCPTSAFGRALKLPSKWQASSRCLISRRRSLG